MALTQTRRNPIADVVEALDRADTSVKLHLLRHLVPLRAERGLEAIQDTLEALAAEGGPGHTYLSAAAADVVRARAARHGSPEAQVDDALADLGPNTQAAAKIRAVLREMRNG